MLVKGLSKRKYIFSDVCKLKLTCLKLKNIQMKATVCECCRVTGLCQQHTGFYAFCIKLCAEKKRVTLSSMVEAGLGLPASA